MVCFILFSQYGSTKATELDAFPSQLKFHLTGMYVNIYNGYLQVDFYTSKEIFYSRDELRHSTTWQMGH